MFLQWFKYLIIEFYCLGWYKDGPDLRGGRGRIPGHRRQDLQSGRQNHPSGMFFSQIEVKS